MDKFQVFVDRFNKSKDATPILQLEIDNLEKELRIKLPADYIDFMKRFGNIWTPDIVNIILENELELDDIQQFWTIAQIVRDKNRGWTSRLKTDIIPFASDSMGHIFGFLRADLQKEKEQYSVYFYDHDFNTIDKLENSFSELIEKYNSI